jgi:uncharacterized protein DUF3592
VRCTRPFRLLAISKRCHETIFRVAGSPMGLRRRKDKFVAYYVVLCAIAVVILSPLLRRLYLERFWVHAGGTVKHLDGSISTNPHAGGAWVWVPIIEYHAAGKTLSGRVSYWQRFNAKSKYSVGDKIRILFDPRDPSRFILDSWIEHIFLTVFLGLVITSLIHARG